MGCTLEWVSILLAGGAFVVAIASLWLTSLRRPRVEVDRIQSSEPELGASLASDGRPSPAHVRIVLYVANSGATGTVVERFDMTDFREVNNGTALWSSLATGRLNLKPVGTRFALDRGEVKNCVAMQQLLWSDAPPIEDAADFARRLVTLRSVSVRLEWGYRRQRFPRVRQRETKTGSVVLDIDVKEFRRRTVSYWRQHGLFPEGVAILEGSKPP